jgi:hypothetical protein
VEVAANNRHADASAARMTDRDRQVVVMCFSGQLTARHRGSVPDPWNSVTGTDSRFT